jgi:hypothetical protein
MKVNIKGLLFLARRHLSILDKVVDELGLNKDEWDYEVDTAQIILDELIDHVSEVQADNSKLKEFAELYCLVEPVHPNVARVDAIWEQAVKDVQDRYNELIKEKNNDTTSTY